MPELLFLRDGELQMRTALRQDRLLIGRAPNADFVIPDRTVSRQQCEIVRRGQGFALVDMSGNGTPVSKRQASLGGTALKDGDEIHLGAFSLVFSAADPPSAAEATTAPSRKAGRTSVHRVSETPSGRTHLRLRQPEGETVIPLRPERGFSIVIGSDPRGPVQLEIKDPFVSAEHCRIAWKDGRWLLADLDSRNGTFVEGVRIVGCVLAGQMRVRIGETLVWFDQEAGGAGAADQPLPGLITRDPIMLPLIDFVRRIAPGSVPIAIHGETGSGKEVVARAVHELSARREGPFVALNCGAIPRETVESELFGHERGAFTGADRTRPGAFAEAHGGTLFLDEIGDLPEAVQVKVLRVLDRGEIRKVGGSRTEQVNVRIVSATHRDLMAAVSESAFREDLYYRLCVAPVEIPPLRRRVADILPLAENFAAALTPGQGPIEFTPGARSRLEAHSWPGNVRELRNTIQLALLNRSGPSITEQDIILREAPRVRGAETLKLAGRTMDQIEREAYRLSILRHDGDKRAAMDELGVPRSTFFRKIEELGLAGDLRRLARE